MLTHEQLDRLRRHAEINREAGRRTDVMSEELEALLDMADDRRPSVSPCSECQHWTPLADEAGMPGWGHCAEISFKTGLDVREPDEEFPVSAVIEIVESEDGIQPQMAFLTHRGFGCRLWEIKP